MITSEKALEILEDGRNPFNTIDTDKWCEAFEMAILALKEQRPKGHWRTIVSHEVGEYRPTKYVCSECGWMIDLCRGLRQEQGFRLFCEHCGADMR